MKTLPAIISATMLISCAGEQAINITGTATNPDGQPILYYTSIQGMCNSQSIDTLKTNPDHTYNIVMESDGYERIHFLTYAKGPIGSAILKKGNYRIDIDGNANHAVCVSGQDKELKEISEMLDSLDRDVFALRARRGDRWNIAQDKTASSVAEKLRHDASRMKKRLKSTDKKLDSAAHQDINMQVLLAFQNQTMATTWRSSKQTQKEWFGELEKMNGYCKIDNEYSPFSPAFYDVVRNECGFRYYNRGDEKIPDNIRSGPQLKFYDFRKHLNGRAQEASIAQTILLDKAEEEHHPDIILIAEEFNRLFPKSPWASLIDQVVAENKAFNAHQIPDYIHFPDISDAEHFNDIIKRYKGKTVYMDIWATWCAPCRQSFAHAGKIQKYAEENKDLVLLYVSIDKAENEQLWKQMTAKYDLAGEHIRINEKMMQELRKLFGDKNGTLYIPRYVIFDKEGKVQNNTASSPADMEKLKKQIEGI